MTRDKQQARPNKGIEFTASRLGSRYRSAPHAKRYALITGISAHRVVYCGEVYCCRMYQGFDKP